MRRRSARSMICLLLICISIVSCARRQPSYDTATVAVLNVATLDISDGSVSRDQMIVIAGDTILAVTPTDADALPEGVRIIDGAGSFALPGLWDSHVHAFADDAVDRVLPLFIAHGVTSIRDWFTRSITARFEHGFDAYYTLQSDFWTAVDWSRCEADFGLLADNGGAFTPTVVMELNDVSRTGTQTFDLLAEGGHAWCLTVLEQIAAADDSLRERAYAATLDALRRIRSTGIPILAGSDTPNNCLAPGASLISELERLVEAGWTPLEALRAATVLPSRILASATGSVCWPRASLPTSSWSPPIPERMCGWSDRRSA